MTNLSVGQITQLTEQLNKLDIGSNERDFIVQKLARLQGESDKRIATAARAWASGWITDAELREVIGQ